MNKTRLVLTTKDPNVLDELSQDEDSDVRRCVARNPNCSERAYKYIKGLEILESLSEVST